MSAGKKASIAFVAIWVVAGAIILFARASRPTAETVTSYLAAHDPAGKSDAELGEMVTTLAGQMNAMTFEERRALQTSEALSRTFRALPAQHQRTYLEQTLPTDLRQTMEALNKMPPAEREEFVNAALKGAAQDLGLNDGTFTAANVHAVVEDGFAAFYNQTSPEVKLQMAPVLERIHQRLRDL